MGNRDIRRAFEEGHRIDVAMNRSFYAAVRLHRAYELPLVMWENGRVVEVDPQEVVLPGDEKLHSRAWP